MLLSAFDALPDARKDAAAGQLSLLWLWFRDAFGGPAEFLARPAEEQDAYLDKLRTAADRSAALKDSDLGRYYFSSAMLSHYLDALRTGDVSPPVMALSERVVWMVERGRKLQQPG
jgi:hypothetical protein